MYLSGVFKLRKKTIYSKINVNDSWTSSLYSKISVGVRLDEARQGQTRLDEAE